MRNSIIHNGWESKSESELINYAFFKESVLIIGKFIKLVENKVILKIGHSENTFEF